MLCNFKQYIFIILTFIFIITISINAYANQSNIITNSCNDISLSTLKRYENLRSTFTAKAGGYWRPDTYDYRNAVRTDTDKIASKIFIGIFLSIVFIFCLYFLFRKKKKWK